MTTTNDLIGKTIKQVKYTDPWSGGLLITFTDDTSMLVTERMQAGEFAVYYAGDKLVSEWHSDPADYVIKKVSFK